jgi:hypothetical protein
MQGFEFVYDGISYKVCVVLLQVTGDNLAYNVIMGYTESLLPDSLAGHVKLNMKVPVKVSSMCTSQPMDLGSKIRIIYL